MGKERAAGPDWGKGTGRGWPRGRVDLAPGFDLAAGGYGLAEEPGRDSIIRPFSPGFRKCPRGLSRARVPAPARVSVPTEGAREGC